MVGAGPSAIYGVQAMLKSDEISRVDVFESLPAPYGLLRYGVAPDHPKTKRVAKALARAFDDYRVRFFGNVHLGRDLTREDLLSYYDAVLYATGARHDRTLPIPGADLPGSIGAADFVAWYTGHPDVARPHDLSQNKSVVVVGAGNVALDVSRISLHPEAALAATDMPREVIEHLTSAPLREVHLLCRRGPEHVKFSRVELAELLELPGVQVFLHVDPAQLADRDDLSREASTNLKLFRAALERHADTADAPRQMHFHFWTAPVEIEGTERVTGVRVVTSVPQHDPQEHHIEAQQVIRAIGYRGQPIEGLPYDPERGAVPHDKGAVIAPAVVGREFVAGWIKRGPTGVIGTNKGDAAESVEAMLTSLPDVPDEGRCDKDITKLLHDRGVQVVSWTEWGQIERAEAALGAEHGTETIKLVTREDLVRAAKAITGGDN